MFLQEVEKILRYAVQWNEQRASIHTRLQAFDSWRQVLELILSVCLPAGSSAGSAEEGSGLPVGEKESIITDLLRHLLTKVNNSVCSVSVEFMLYLHYNILVPSTKY